MKHSNLYLGLVLPSGGWQSLIGQIVVLLKLKLTDFILQVSVEVEVWRAKGAEAASTLSLT